MENYSLSDIAAVTDGGMFGGGNNGILWLFAILLLGGGGYGWGGRNQAATTEDLASGFNFSALQNKTNDILAAVNNNNQVLGNAICQLGYQDLQNFNMLERQIAECCCQAQLGVQSVKFDMANYAAAINANTTAQTQRILDKMCEDKTAAMAARIQSLELQQALCGVVRYPMTTTYSTACNPFFANGCCNGSF